MVSAWNFNILKLEKIGLQEVPEAMQAKEQYNYV